MTDDLIASLIAIAHRANVPIVVDPKSANFQRYAGATVVAPNIKEAVQATGISVETDADAARAGLATLASTGIASILLTRSERGITLVSSRSVSQMSASAREVFDVAGAGDMVVASLGLGLAAGLDLAEAAQYHTVADTRKAEAHDLQNNVYSLEQGVADYVDEMTQGKGMENTISI